MITERLLKKAISCLEKALIFLVLLSCAGISAEDFVLVKDGKPQVALVANTQVSAVQDFFISEVAKCGVELAKRDAATGGRIVFEIAEAPMEEEDAFSIEFPDSQTMQIKCTPVSARWAVNHLLESAFGVRWIFPQLSVYGDEINDYPKAENISVKAETFIQKPYSLYVNRGMGWRFASAWNPNMGHKLNMCKPHWITVDVFPVYKYAPDQSWPEEIMPVLNGKKLKLPKPKSLPLSDNIWLAKRAASSNPLGVNYDNGWNPCFSNPKTTEIAIANILERLKENPTQKIITMTVNDNGGFCQCDACKKAVGDKRNFSGYQDYSELFWKWVNDVAMAVSKEYPDVWFNASGYRETMTPPSFKLHPRIVAEYDFEIQAMADEKMHDIRMEQMKAWADSCSHLSIYSYDYGKGFFLFPRLSLNLQSRMLKEFYHEFHLCGLYQEAYFLPFDGPKYHVMYRLMRNMDENPESIAEEWCRNAVGTEAAPALRKYFQFWEDYWCGTEIRKTQWYKSVKNIYMQLGERPSHTFALQKGEMKMLRSLMEEVVAKAGTPQQKRRADVLMKYFEYAEDAAQALFSELIHPEGKLDSADEALELLRQVPDALQAANRFEKHPYNCLDKNDARISLLSTTLLNIGLVLQFRENPAVRAQLQKMVDDGRLPDILRGQIKIWLGEKADNLIANGSFEQDGETMRPLWSSKLSGTVDTARASDGKCSFRTRNGYYVMTPKMEPGKNYLFLCDIFIAQGSNEGRFTMRLGPSQGPNPKNWLKMEYVPTGGIWNTYCAVISHPKDVDNLQIQLWFQKFENNEPVWIDNLRFICLDEFMAE